MSHNNEENGPSLKEEVDQILRNAGGWLHVIERVAPIFSSAIANLGRGVNCPFPQRHRKSGGVDAFRFSNEVKYAGRAICSCNQDGWTPIDLLIEAGVGGNFTQVCLEIKKAYNGSNSYTAKAKSVVPAPKKARPTFEENARKSAEHNAIVKDCIHLGAVEARIGRLYFRRRGIPLNAAIGDVMFHPALPYHHTYVENEERKKICLGRFPAIISVFRNHLGKVMNLHRIYLSEDGRKLEHPMAKKTKKVCSGLDGWSKTSVPVATVAGCRTLHICEGVEKGWAIHLATAETVRSANSCTSLPGQWVSRADYDDVVLWADHDPYNEKREKHGDGQTYMWKLFIQLIRQGFRVCLMLPDTNPTTEAKGPDWEDLIVANGVLDLPIAERFDRLREFAQEGGVFTPRGHAKKSFSKQFEAGRVAA